MLYNFSLVDFPAILSFIFLIKHCFIPHCVDYLVKILFVNYLMVNIEFYPTKQFLFINI